MKKDQTSFHQGSILYSPHSNRFSVLDDGHQSILATHSTFITIISVSGAVVKSTVAECFLTGFDLMGVCKCFSLAVVVAATN